MRVFLRCLPDQGEVRIFRRMEDEQGSEGERVLTRLAAGMAWRGYTYEELLRLGSGHYELAIPRAMAGQLAEQVKKGKRRK